MQVMSTECKIMGSRGYTKEDILEVTLPRFHRVGEEKSDTLSEGGDYGKTTTKL